MKHLAIIPARNEVDFVGTCIRSLLSQSVPPDKLVVVDDGSSDGTSAVLSSLSSDSNRLEVIQRRDRGGRRLGPGVVQAFNQGYRKYGDEHYDLISKFDADLEFPEDYCERIIEYMTDNPNVGVAGGTLIEVGAGRRRRARSPAHHPEGPVKTYRMSVFEEMDGFIPSLGFDVLDLVQTRLLGYRTVRLDDLQVKHFKGEEASGIAALREKALWGRGAYVMRSHPLFVFGRALYRSLDYPYIMSGLAFLWGYLGAVTSNRDRLPQSRLTDALRREQLYRLTHSNSLPPDSRVPPQ